MEFISTSLPGVTLVKPRVFGDERGYFLETFHSKKYAESGIHNEFLQDNLSKSEYGVLRGLHLQNPNSQGKLVSVIEGEVFDVAVDVRVGSPYFGKWVGATLSGENKHQLWVPPGFAHGFVVTSETAIFHYKCTDWYSPEHELSILWNDPEIGIEWPIQEPKLSPKDAHASTLAQALEGRRLLEFS